MKKKQARILRVLEYEGDIEWVNDCIAKRGVKGSYNCGKGIIREAIIGDAIEIFEKELEYGI